MQLLSAMFIHFIYFAALINLCAKYFHIEILIVHSLIIITAVSVSVNATATKLPCIDMFLLLSLSRDIRHESHWCRNIFGQGSIPARHNRIVPTKKKRQFIDCIKIPFVFAACPTHIKSQVRGHSNELE